MGQWTATRQDRRTCFIFLFLAIFFTVFGIVLAVLTADIKEVVIRYDDVCPDLNSQCQVAFTVSETLPSPVYVYYKLVDYHQNHRKYITSKDDDQLNGENKDVADLSRCAPYVTNKDGDKSQSFNGGTLNDDDPMIPCGAIAYSFFNDDFQIRDKANNQISISNEGIAWEADKTERYKNIDPSKQWTDVTDERFMNWMRVAARPTFRKLWGIINSDVEAGTYSLNIDNNFNSAAFNSNKYLILTTINSFGGQNTLLAVCYLVAAFISWIIFIIFQKKSKQKTQ